MDHAAKQLLAYFSIDHDELVRTFSGVTIARGLDYFRKKRVVDIQQVLPTIDGGIVVVGRVSNGRDKTYSVRLELFVSLNGLAASSNCNCPVGMDCKHGVALMFALLTRLKAADLEHDDPARNQMEQQRVEQWLKEVEDDEAELASRKTNSDGSNTSYHLIYLLSFKSVRGRELLWIEPVKSRVLKAGGYGKPSRVQYHHLSGYEVRYGNGLFCTDDELLVCNALVGDTFAGRRYNNFIDGHLPESSLGENFLNVLLETGRCFWETQEKRPPLTAGGARQASIEWVDHDEKMVPQLQCDEPYDAIFRLRDYHYIDLKNHQCGRLMCHGLTPHQVGHFLSAPPVPKAIAEDVSEKLLSLFPTSSMPLPQPIEIEDVSIKGVSPQIGLRLHSGMVSEERHSQIASLAFNYGEVAIKPQTEEEFQQAMMVISSKVEGMRKRYHLWRDLDTEQAALGRLQSLGFTSLYPEWSSFGILDMTVFGGTLLESVERWDHFISTVIPELREEGWEVTVADDFNLSVEIVDDWLGDIEESEGGEWFELSLGFELEGERINLLPLLVGLLRQYPDTIALRQKLTEEAYQLFELKPGQWVKLPSPRILQVLDVLVELYDTDSLNADGNLEFSKQLGYHYGALLNDPNLRWKGAEELQALSNKIKQFKGVETVVLPSGLQAQLRNYQQAGYDWLQFLRQFQFNGILADDMGLGKTIQALACLLKEKESGRVTGPSLVIAPTSLMSNWRREVERFTPSLSVLTLQGRERLTKFDEIASYDLVLTTYPLILRDAKHYEEQPFYYLILDEAQLIKNARSKTTVKIRELKATHRLCLSGTPIENHLGELWSMYHFLMPGYLGTEERFNRLFRKPIEREGDGDRGQQLRSRVQPFMLRRTKDLVTQELPEKTEIIRSVSLSGKQRDLYETVRLAMDKKVRDEIGKKGLARSHIMILDALLKLRQVCCDPRLVKLEKATKVKESAKLELLMSMIPEMVESGRKILIFSQFTTMLGLIGAELNKHKIEYSKLTGQTRKREAAIDHFQEGSAKVFLISLKAGGTGLNLTAADTVIHYDPWWNPAVEQQATDRAYRIGQDKPVFVYKLLTEETVEEKILKLQERKQALADSVYGGKKQQGPAFDQNDLMELLKPLE